MDLDIPRKRAHDSLSQKSAQEEPQKATKIQKIDDSEEEPKDPRPSLLPLAANTLTRHHTQLDRHSDKETVILSAGCSSHKTSSSSSAPCTAAKWLEGAKAWKGIPNNWKPIRVLGRGSYGIVGLFQNVGQDQSMPNYIVVKQAPPGVESDALRSESLKLEQLMELGAKYVVKVYKSFHQAPGTGADEKWDPYPWVTEKDGTKWLDLTKMVGRLYLEYAPGGDLAHVVKERGRDDDEEEVWRLLNHLAKGAKELERGNGTNLVSRCRPIVHFDLRPYNVLVFKDEAGKDFYKLADFGMSSWLPHDQDAEWVETVEWRGAPAWLTPEQAYRNHPERQFGPHTNIWAIGMTAYAFLCRSHHPENELFVARWKKKKFVTQQSRLLEIEDYSDMLKLTLLQCLAFRPSKRITADTLIERSEGMLDFFLTDNPMKSELLHLVPHYVGPSRRHLGRRIAYDDSSDDRPRVFVEGEPSTMPGAIDLINIGDEEEEILEGM